MTMKDWLTQLGLAQYISDFSGHHIELDMLGELSDADLQQIGVLSLGHRRKILRAAQQLAFLPAVIDPATDPIAPAQRQAERRQLTVLIADMVESTALAARFDPEDMGWMLERYRAAVGAVVEKYHGFAAPYLGDGVMAYFGYPMAHENDAERAVRAGLEIVKEVVKLADPLGAPLTCRVGIATGLVVVGDVFGSPEHKDSVVGETPNLAARLQEQGNPGQVLISADTCKLLPPELHLKQHPPLQLKGLPEPVAYCEALGVFQGPRRKSSEDLVPLLGRRAEMELLNSAWEKAQQGDSQVIFLSGPPGIGKTRLLSAFADAQKGQDIQLRRYYGSSFHSSSAGHPVVVAVENDAGITRDDPVEIRLNKLDRLLRAGGIDPKEAGPFLAPLLGLDAGQRYPAPAVAGSAASQKAYEYLVGRLLNMSHGKPLLGLFEDAHFTDPTTVELYQHLVERSKGLPVMFVVTHRPEFEGLHGLSPLHETIIELARLTKPDAAELIQVVARGQKLPKSLVDQIIERSDGIPLYLEEMTKSLLESNELVARDGRFELADPLATLEIPVTLKDSLMARLDKLSEVKQIAQIGSVLGRRFPRSLLAAVAETSPQSLERALQVLVEDELLFVSGADPDPVYTFKHSMIRDAAYESILNSRRAELHHRVAELLLTRFPDETETLPQVVATHSERAGEVAQAAQYWLKAGHKALAAHAITEALRHLRRGLSMLPHLAPSEQRDRLSFGLHRAMGLAQISAVGWTAKEVEQHFTQALELGEKLGSYRELMTVIFGLWSHWANRAEAGKAAAAIAKAEEIALIDLDGDWHLVLHVMKLVQELWFGSHYEAIREADALLALYDPERHRYLLSMFTQDPRVFAYGFRSWAQWSVGNTEQALADAITSEKIAREMGRPFDLCWQLTLGSLVHYFNRDRDRLADHVQEAMVLAQEQNVDLVKHVVGPAFQGLVHVLGREWQAAQAVFAQALETWKFGGGRVLLPLLEGSLGFVAMRAGNYERGMLALRAGIQSAERNQELWLVPELHRLLARGLAETDPKAAQETLIKARDLAQAQGAFGVLHQIEADLACLLA